MEWNESTALLARIGLYNGAARDKIKSLIEGDTIKGKDGTTYGTASLASLYPAVRARALELVEWAGTLSNLEGQVRAAQAGCADATLEAIARAFETIAPAVDRTIVAPFPRKYKETYLYDPSFAGRARRLLEDGWYSVSV